MSDTIVGRVAFGNGGYQAPAQSKPDFKNAPSGGSSGQRRPPPAVVGSIDIARLNLSEGDVLVVRTDRPTSSETDKRIRANLTPLLPQGVKIMIIDRSIELSVLTKGELDAKVA